MRESGHNYLETIFLLQREIGRVRSIDVAKALDYSKPSVSRAMGILRDEGLLEIAQNGDLTLTKEGTKQAKALVERQEVLTQFLMMTTDVEQETAQTDAKKMMHYISDKTFAGVKSFIKQVEEYNAQE